MIHKEKNMSKVCGTRVFLLYGAAKRLADRRNKNSTIPERYVVKTFTLAED